MRTSLRTVSLPDTFNRQTTSVISLDQVRPGLRTTNEYVDSPRTQPVLPIKPQLASLGGGHSPGFAHRVNVNPHGREANFGSPRPVLTTSSSPVVSQQPLSKSPTLKKEPVVSADGSSHAEGTQYASNHAVISVGDNIICDRCGKCRCADCTEPQPLPSRWCCRGTCELSLDRALDVCTCFWCVKCTFYHCGPEEDNDSYEDPCGCCSTPHCCQRWAAMGLMALCLPCLCFYWPARACLASCKLCYNHCRHKGCQCHLESGKTTSLFCGGGPGKGVGQGGEGGFHSKHSQTRRLLIESESSST